jgi:hypothetical protein
MRCTIVGAAGTEVTRFTSDAVPEEEVTWIGHADRVVSETNRICLADVARTPMHAADKPGGLGQDHKRPFEGVQPDSSVRATYSQTSEIVRGQASGFALHRGLQEGERFPSDARHASH